MTSRVTRLSSVAFSEARGKAGARAGVFRCRALLEGKRCLVTGGSSGIGEAIATAYAKEGASLLISGRNVEALRRTADRCSDLGAERCDVYAADLTEPADVQRLAKHALELYDTVDVLVNNAGRSARSGNAVLQGDPAEWNEILHLNLYAPMALTQALVPQMVAQRDGVVINLGSVAGTEPMKSQAAYAATKWGLRGWSLSCQQELRQYNIKVCVIQPNMVRRARDKGPSSRGNPDRMLETEDVAEAALLPFKTSSKCVPSEITLQLTLPVHG